MTSYQEELEDTIILSHSMSDMEETVLFPLTPGAENRRQRLQPPVTPTRTDPGGGGDGGASDADITLTQAASRLIDSASKIAALTFRAELRTSTPKRKRGAEGDGDAAGPASSSSDDRPDWQEKSTVKPKRYRKREIRTQRRKLLKDMTQLLSVMAKEEEQLSSSSDEQPDWIDSPLEKRRQLFKIGKRQSKDKKPVQPAVTAKPKASENSKKTHAHNHMPEFDNYFPDDLLLNATPGTVSHKGTDAAEDKGETVKKTSSPKTAHETTLSEDEAIQQMLNAATLEDDVLCPATCSSQTQRSAKSVSGLADQKLKSVTVVDETFSSGDDIAQELMNVARIHEAVDVSEISSPRKELRQTPSDATTDAELLSHLLEHDVTLSEEEAIYEMLDHTVVEGEDQEKDLGEELVKKTAEGVESTEEAESSRRDNTAAEFQQPGPAEGCAKACNDLRKEAVSRTDMSSPSLLANWGRVAPASGLQLNHSHGNQLEVNNSKVCNTNSEILGVKQGRDQEEKEARMPSSHPGSAPSPSLLEYCEEEPAARQEQGVDTHGSAEQYTDETVYMEPTSTTSMLKMTM